jgi:predicted nuclease of predicted toxin-antitoxin system
MQLLFDQNLPPRLRYTLADVYPDSLHVRDVNLQNSDDSVIWEFARKNHFCIVSKDGDFQRRATLYGSPPKVVWLRVGNCAVTEIESLLLHRSSQIQDFIINTDKDLLIIDRELV